MDIDANRAGYVSCVEYRLEHESGWCGDAACLERVENVAGATSLRVQEHRKRVGSSCARIEALNNPIIGHPTKGVRVRCELNITRATDARREPAPQRPGKVP